MSYPEQQIQAQFEAGNATHEELERVRDELSAALAQNAELLSCLHSIQLQCLMQITMSYILDAESIGQQIYQATGMTEPELREKVKS